MAVGRKTGGRRKGSLNKTTMAAREFAQSIVEDPEYRQTVRARALASELAPPLEAMLWHYAYGKPHESVEVSTPNGGLTIRHVFATEPAR